MSNPNHCRGQQLIYRPLKVTRDSFFFFLSPVSLLLEVIQRSNEIIVDDKQPIFGRQSVSLLNFFVAEDIVHFLPNFVATWNPPLKVGFHRSTNCADERHKTALNFCVKNTTDLLFGRCLWSSVGSFVVGRSQKRYNETV